jgi:hypothetical protein
MGDEKMKMEKHTEWILMVSEAIQKIGVSR